MHAAQGTAARLVGMSAAVCAWCCAAVAAGTGLGAETETGTASGRVVPVDWKRFKPYGHVAAGHRDLEDCARVLLCNAFYNLSWAPKAAEEIERGQGVFGRPAHDTIRPASSASFGLAVLLKTGVFDQKAAGCTKEEALARTVRLLKAAAARHKKQWWGYPWQSALWASQLGHAGWLLWDELDGETRGTLAELVEAEANRFIEYRVPYWNGKGGDTKAEENAWNSTVLSIAVAMMPGHANARKWKEKCSELMVSAYATKKDLQNPTVVDGRPVRDWLRGYNAREDGSVVNHGFIHPDYMRCITLNLRAYAVQPLAGQPVPEAADFNVPLVYRCFVTKQWPSPPYSEPGGTIYTPGKPRIYYPQRADWGRHHYVFYYLLDTHVHQLGLDRGLPHRAQEWMRVRAKGLLAMQLRHADRRMFADGELDTWVGREQTAAHALGTAFLLHWLEVQGVPISRENWLSAETDRPRCQENDP